MKRASLIAIAALIVGVGLGSLSLISVSAQNVPVTTVTGTVTADSELAAAAALADNTANPTIPGVAAFLMTWDGATWDRAALASDWTVGTAIGTTAPGAQAVYSDFDGAALPTITNVDTEGEAVPTAASIKGVQYFMPVNEDGSATAQIRIWDGTDTALVDGSGYLQVSLASVPSHAVTNAGTFATQVNGDALTALQSINNIVGVEDAAETAGGGLAMAGAVVRSTAAGSSATAGDNATINVDTLGRMWTRNGNPCADHARITTAAISTSSSGNVEIVALNGSDLIYVCGYSVVAAAATGVQFIYGTGTACATGETDLTGVWSFAANGGITNGNAGVPNFVVPAGNAFCVENSGANAIAGHISYVRTAAP